MNSKILEKIRTKEDQENLLEEINILLSAIYENKGQGLEVALRNKVRSWVADYFRNEFSVAEENVENFLISLRKDLSKLESLKLTVAFETTSATLDNLSYFIKKQIGENVILDINYDRSIIGGCIMVFKGKYKDLSIKRMFDKEFEKIRPAIFKLIAHQYERL